MSRRKEIPNLIKKIMLILAGLQIALGVIWIACNLTRMPDFQETRDVLNAAETMVFDEYMGILYPMILRIFFVFGSGFYVPVYLLQLVFAVWSYHYFLRSIMSNHLTAVSKKYLWLFTGYMISFPMILQSHMSILPYSLASSLLLLLLAEGKVHTTDEKVSAMKSMIKICVLWLVIGLLIPDYGIIVAFFVVPGFLITTWKRKKQLLIFLCAVVITITTLFTTLSLVQTQGSYGRMQKSVNSVLLTRFAWPYFQRDGFYWDFKEWIDFDEGELNWISMYPENVFYVFGPKLESTIGKEQANAIYEEMARLSFSIGKRAEMADLGRDIWANAAGPFALQYQLSGRGVSYTGWNYYQMMGNVHGLTKYFVRFSLYAFVFMFVMTVWIGWDKRKQYKWFDKIKKSMPTVLGMGVMVLWYTMIGNGMQDYLKVIPILLFWCTLPMLGLSVIIRENTENGAE